ncbi:restriction endonuclease [Enterococcus faecalis]|uniref:Lar family restriction alleviation protein n=1 Tax=Enterococcus faecalis TaxID=1351 RepID=UPI001A966E99|nr:Lar family restriction alleviation protein [Enterococcus faecalis]MBO1106105.1 restriction endonuclease [Enterococcus faecalis]
MNEIHLKPCPFCGSENISFNAFSISSDAYVLCEQCNASIEISVPWDDMDEKEHDKVCLEKLSVLWNKRTSESNQPEINPNQQIVLNRLKNEGNACSPIGAVSVMMAELEENLPLYYALSSLKRKGHAQILRNFAEWVIEQEETECL